MIDKSLKEIIVNNVKLYYKVIETTDGVFIYTHTNFYETNDKYKLTKKYGIFGKLVKRYDNKVVFSTDINIESEKYTKYEIRKLILEKLKLLGRKQEINKGEIV